MAKPYVRGPGFLFANVGGGGSAVFLGTAERSPRIQVRPHFSPVYNDLAGQSVPLDMSFDGEDGFVIADLTRWNESGYAALASRPRFTGARGTSVPGDIGTLMITEGWAYGLYCLFPYQSKTAYADMPPGYHFPAAFLEGPDDLDNINTTGGKVRLIWHCLRAYAINSGQPGATFTLYDTLTASFNGLLSLVN